MTIFGLNYFEIPRAPSKLLLPIAEKSAQLNWPGWLAGISEGARGISKYFFLDHFSPALLSQKLSFQDLRF